MITSCVVKRAHCISQTCTICGPGVQSVPRKPAFWLRCHAVLETHGSKTGHRVTYQFTKSTAAVNARRSPRGARGLALRNAKKPHKIIRGERAEGEGAEPSRVELAGVGGEWNRTNEWWKPPRGCWLSARRQALHQWPPPPRAAGAQA